MVSVLIVIIAIAWGGICLVFSPGFYRCWREPVLRHPVLIFESDDWGAGPPEQTAALGQLRELLARFQDKSGRHPVMTIGVILAIADTARIHGQDGQHYFSRDLGQSEFGAVREQLIKGRDEGVFALQLHGREHYWPDSLMRAAQSHSAVRSWLTGEGIPRTEQLPAHLQARWTDASELPSRPLSEQQVLEAIKDERALFAHCFGQGPRVAVATTFVWNEDVERAWAAQGIDAIVTPGRRYTLRDAQGQPGGIDKTMRNGDVSQAGQIYLVRDVYFEPALGHDATRLVEGGVQRVRLGRPILVEIHRFNFLGGAQRINTSLSRMEEGIAAVLRTLPNVRFMATAQLAEALRLRDGAIVEQRFAARLRVWLQRIEELGRFRKLATFSGLGAVLWLVKQAVRV